jgi:hypothetical protein
MTAPRKDAPDEGTAPYPEPSSLNLQQRKCRVVLDTGRIFKAGRATQGGGYAYVKHDDVMAEVRESMARHGLMLRIAPDMEHSIRAEFGKTSNGAMQYRWLLWVDFRLTNADDPNDTETVRYPGEGVDTGDKAIGKALSYATKNYLLKTFLLPSGDEADNEHGPQPEPQRQQGQGQGQRQGQRQRQEQDPAQEAHRKAQAAFFATLRDQDIGKDTAKRWLARNYKVESTKDATPEQLQGARAWALEYKASKARVQELVQAGADLDAIATFIGAGNLGIENPETMTLAEWAEVEHYAKQLAEGIEPPGRGPEASMADLANAALDKLQATRLPEEEGTA